MHGEGGSDSYGRSQADDPWNDDKRKSYVKRMIKDSKDQPAQFRRPDYVSGLGVSPEQESPKVSAQVNEEAKGEAKPAEKKKEQYEL